MTQHRTIRRNGQVWSIYFTLFLCQVRARWPGGRKQWWAGKLTISSTLSASQFNINHEGMGASRADVFTLWYLGSLEWVVPCSEVNYPYSVPYIDHMENIYTTHICLFSGASGCMHVHTRRRGYIFYVRDLAKLVSEPVLVQCWLLCFHLNIRIFWALMELKM